MNSLIVFLLAASGAIAAGDVTDGVPRGVEGLERVGDRAWTTSTGATVICGGRRGSADRQAILIEVQLTAVLDSVCRYLVDEINQMTSAANDLEASQQDVPKVSGVNTHHSVGYSVVR